MNHDELVDYFATLFGYINNHKKRGKRHIEELDRNFIPDLIGDNEYVEIELTGNKDFYNEVNDKRKILIIGINSYEAFDDVRIYKIDNPRELKHFQVRHSFEVLEDIEKPVLEA